MNLPTSAPNVRQRMDWRGYYRAFCELHGEPLVIRGRQCFPDGWAYSATDYRGPEWPPPADPEECKQVRREYWQLRRQRVLAELATLRRTLDDVKQEQRMRSAPLQEVRSTFDKKEGAWIVLNRGPLTTDVQEGRLYWLEDDLTLCDAALRELKDGTGLAGRPELAAVQADAEA